MLTSDVIDFGKHYGTPVTLLVLKNPAYVWWMLSQPTPRGKLVAACSQARRLIALFDNKPIIYQCNQCENRATRGTVWQGNVHPYWWCDSCSSRENKALVIRDYLGALSYVGAFCDGRQGDMKVLIRLIAEAKGLPPRVGVMEADSFFRSASVPASPGIMQVTDRSSCSANPSRKLPADSCKPTLRAVT
jgi:hypothetical protein